MAHSTEIAPGLAVAAQLDKGDFATLAGAGIRTIINNRPDSEGVPITAAAARAEAERHGIGYAYLPVTSATISAADVAAFDRLLQDSPKPIVAHCRTGTRTYLLWAAAQAVNHRAEPQALVAAAAAKGYDIKALPALVERLKSGA
jgi:sulfide:quinone oxidoreductase